MTELASMIQFMDNKVQMLQKAERLEREGNKEEAEALLTEWMNGSAVAQMIAMR